MRSLYVALNVVAAQLLSQEVVLPRHIVLPHVVIQRNLPEPFSIHGAVTKPAPTEPAPTEPALITTPVISTDKRSEVTTEEPVTPPPSEFVATSTSVMVPNLAAALDKRIEFFREHSHDYQPWSSTAVEAPSTVKAPTTERDIIESLTEEFNWTSGVIGAAAAGGFMGLFACGVWSLNKFSASRLADQTESISVYDSESILGADLDEFLN